MKTWRDETSGVVHSAFYNEYLYTGGPFNERWTTGCWIIIEVVAEIYHVHRRPITCMTCMRWAS